MDNQNRQIAVLQNDLQDYARCNEDLTHEGNAINGTLVEARGMINQREIEVTKLCTDIQRTKDEGLMLNKEIENAQRNLRDAHIVKDKQHERLYQLTAMLKKQEQHNFSCTAKAN